MGLLRDLAAALEMSEATFPASSCRRRTATSSSPSRSATASDRRVIAQPQRSSRPSALCRHGQALRLAHSSDRHRLSSGQEHRRQCGGACRQARHPEARLSRLLHSITPLDFEAVSSEARSIRSRPTTRLLLHCDPLLAASAAEPAVPLHRRAVLAVHLQRRDGAARPRIRDIARAHSARCTRYADDITLSANSIENLLRRSRRSSMWSRVACGRG